MIPLNAAVFMISAGNWGRVLHSGRKGRGTSLGSMLEGARLPIKQHNSGGVNGLSIRHVKQPASATSRYGQEKIGR